MKDDRLVWQLLQDPSGPFYFRFLDDSQKKILRDWFSETTELNIIGETSVAAIGVLSGLILGSRITRIIQCGHYAGFSLIVLGMLLRNVLPEGRIVSFDIDQKITRFTNAWINKAGIEKHAIVNVVDSSDPYCLRIAEDELGGRPGLVFIDSSHQFDHTINELDLWSSFVAPGGFICLHDASSFADKFDFHGHGGVRAAIQVWLSTHPEVSGLIIDPKIETHEAIYKDPCGLAILQVSSTGKEREQPLPSQRRLVSDPMFKNKYIWQLGEGWVWTDNGVSKSNSGVSSLAVPAPIIGGERYLIQIELCNVVSGGVIPVAGGSEDVTMCFQNGLNSCTITAGTDNFLMGVMATEDFNGRILSFKASIVDGNELS